MSDRNIEAIDVLPTIADIRGIRLPWAIDGHSALDATLAECPEKVMFSGQGSQKRRLAFGPTIEAECDTLEQQLAVFGSGTTRDMLGLVTAVLYAGYLLSVKRLREALSVATIMLWSGTVTSAALLPVALLSGERVWPVSLNGWGILWGLALISQVGGQSLIAYALAHLPAAFSSVGLLLQPVMATIFAWLILGETIGSWQAVGGGFVLGGILAARRESRAG